MKVSVQFFAFLHDVTGVDRLDIDTRDHATVSDLFLQLVESYPSIAPFRSSLLIAVNEEYAPASRMLTSNDRVALLPPVSGG